VLRVVAVALAGEEKKDPGDEGRRHDAPYYTACNGADMRFFLGGPSPGVGGCSPYQMRK
jgi:hypothetical protein